jgi:hypothetical protein
MGMGVWEEVGKARRQQDERATSKVIINIRVRHGVSKGVEDGRRPPTL